MKSFRLAMLTAYRVQQCLLAGTIFGDVPDFDAVLATVETLQRSFNDQAA